MTDERGTVKTNGTAHDRRSSRAYWMQTGVIQRWQLIAVYVLIVGAGMVGFSRTQDAVHHADRASAQAKALAVENRRVARVAAALAVEVRDQRAKSILDSCRDTNMRHHAALAKTNQLLARPAVPPSRVLTERQKQAQRAAIREWISTIVPRKNCDKVVKDATTSP